MLNNHKRLKTGKTKRNSHIYILHYSSNNIYPSNYYCLTTRKIGMLPNHNNSPYNKNRSMANTYMVYKINQLPRNKATINDGSNNMAKNSANYTNHKNKRKNQYKNYINLTSSFHSSNSNH